MYLVNGGFLVFTGKHSACDSMQALGTFASLEFVLATGSSRRSLRKVIEQVKNYLLLVAGACPKLVLPTWPTRRGSPLAWQ
jgi:hypothetical protein